MRWVSAHDLLIGWPGARLAQAVGIRRALDLDDLGAEVGEQPAQFAACDDHAEVEYPQSRRTAARRRAGHVGRSDGALRPRGLVGIQLRARVSE